MRRTQARWRLGHRPALDGLRGVAILLVVADHGGYLREPAGGIGVTVFFVLSGFLITRVIVEARDSGTWSMPGFVANRFVRLFPALLLMVTVVSAVMAQRGFRADRIADHAVPALTYVQNMAPRMRFPVFGQTWSLAVEEQFYLLWPLALPWVLGRVRPTARAPRSHRRLGGCDDRRSRTTGCPCTPTLCSPAVSWLCWARSRVAGGWSRRVRWASSSRSWLAPSFHQIYVYGPLVATPAAVLLVAGAVHGNGVLELPVLRFFGRISYAWYLWHVPMLRLTETTFGRTAAIPSIALSLVAAVMSTLLLEEPLRRAWRVHHSSAGVTPHDALT